MWASIIGIINGLGQVLNKILSVWMSERERQAGRNEERLQNAREAIEAQRKADEIDARPSIRDRAELLKRLRRGTGTGLFLDSSNPPRTGNG
jgi:hypothetical protein